MWFKIENMKKMTLIIELPNGYLNGLSGIPTELYNLQYYLTETGDFEQYIPATIKRLEEMGVKVDYLNSIPIKNKE